MRSFIAGGVYLTSRNAKFTTALMVVLKNIGSIEFLAILIESEDLISMFVACGRNFLALVRIRSVHWNSHGSGICSCKIDLIIGSHSGHDKVHGM